MNEQDSDEDNHNDEELDAPDYIDMPTLDPFMAELCFYRVDTLFLP